MRFLLAFLAGTVLCLGAQAQDKELANSYRFYNGVMLYSMGNLSDAGTVFAYGLDRDNRHAPSLYYLAKMAYDRSKTTDAEKSLKSALTLVNAAIEIDSTELDFKLLQGQIYVSMGDYTAAQQVFDYLLIRQNDPQYKRLNAALLAQMGQFDKAAKACDSFELQYGLDENVAEIKYMALMGLRKYYELEEYLGRVVDAFPLNTSFLLSLADINTTMRRDSTAVVNYKRAIAIDSTNANGYLALARYYQYKNDTKNYLDILLPYFRLKGADSKEKVAIFERDFFTPTLYRDHYASIRRLASALLLSASDDSAVRMVYGRFLTYTGQLDEAFDHYKAMYDDGIESEDIYVRVGEILIYRKEFGRADSVLWKGLERYPSSVPLAQNAIVSLWLGGNVKSALKLSDMALKAFKADSVRSLIHSIKGDIYHELKDERRCYASYEKALKLNGSNVAVLNNYAYFLALGGRNLERALAMSTLACEIESANPTYLDTKAWVLYTMGRYGEALQIQQAALGLDSDNSSELLLHYGDILYANGDDFLARTYWKRALEAGADKGVIEQRLARPKALNSR